MQRELTAARRARHERSATATAIAAGATTVRRARRGRALRVQIGHALIGAGSWLSGERVEAVRSSAHRPA
jgi:hypothetical protein